jgi:hypothetical protein
MRAPNFHGNIIVSNLPEGFTAVELAGLFDDFGLVLGAEMARNKARQGSLMLAPESAVEKAIEALNGQTLADRALKLVRAPAPVKRAKPARPAFQRPSVAPTASVERAAPEHVAEAVRRFRALDGDSPATSATAAPARQVVVEYRKTRRFELPPRAPIAARG